MHFWQMYGGLLKTLENQVHSWIERLVGPNCENTVKLFLSGHSKKDKTKVKWQMVAYRKSKVLHNVPFCNIFDLH